MLESILISVDEKSNQFPSIKLSGFSWARDKIFEDDDIKQNDEYSEYASPEIMDNNFGFGIDVWAYGIILYIVEFGAHPSSFNHNFLNDYKLEYPHSAGMNKNLLDLIYKCLTRDPSKRIQMNSVLNHSYFFNLHVQDYSIFSKIFNKTLDKAQSFVTDEFAIDKIKNVVTNTQFLAKMIKIEIDDIEKSTFEDINNLLLLRKSRDIYKLYHAYIMEDKLYLILESFTGRTLKSYIPTLGGKLLVKEFIYSFASSILNALLFLQEYQLLRDDILITPDTLYVVKAQPLQLRVAGFNQFIQKAIESPKDEAKLEREHENIIDKFGSVLSFMIFGSHKFYEILEDTNLENNIRKHPESEKILSDLEYKCACKLISKCHSGQYKTLNDIDNDEYFKRK